MSRVCGYCGRGSIKLYKDRDYDSLCQRCASELKKDLSDEIKPKVKKNVSDSDRLYAEHIKWTRHERVVIQADREVKSRLELRQEMKGAANKVDADYTDFGELANHYKSATDNFIEHTGKRPPEKELEYMGDKLHYVGETITRKEQEAAAKARTPEEWAELERQHYSIAHDLEDYERGILKLFYRSKNMKKRHVGHVLDRLAVCAKWDCDTVFVQHDQREKYCCRLHWKEQKPAERRFTKYGTYLPREAYIDQREESKQKAILRYEVNLTMELQELIDDKGNVVAEPKRKEVDYRDQAADEYDKYSDINKRSNIISYNIKIVK